MHLGSKDVNINDTLSFNFTTNDYENQFNFYNGESEILENYFNTIKNNTKYKFQNRKLENSNTKINRGFSGKKKFNAFGNYSKKRGK